MNPPTIERYPGTRSFSDDVNDQHLFFGRDEEIDTLFHRVCATRLLVLFGKSGLGKTSLLQAGVFHKLRERNNLPIPVRLNLPESPLTLIKNAAEAYQYQNPDIVYTEGVGDTLWEFFKTAMFWRGDVLLTPVLVFDQFEEIFTLKTPEQRAALARELGDLFRGTLPHSVRERRQTARSGDELGVTRTLSEQAPNVRVILSLREDYLGALQELTTDIPTIFDDRIRLSPLTKEQAQQAICIPAGLAQHAATNGHFKSHSFNYEADALAEIIDFLRGKSEVIEPFQLQLICRHVEEQLLKDKLTTVTRKGLGGRKSLVAIVSSFYKQTIAKLPKRDRRHARRLCEEGLLNAEGFRLTLQEKQILTDYRISPASLEALVEERLLRKEPRLQSYFYELSHDSLAQPILDSRPLKFTRKQHTMLRAGLLALLALSGYVYWQEGATQQAHAEQKDAQRKRDEAARARDAAEKVLGYLVYDLQDKLKQANRMDIFDDVHKQVEQYFEDVGPKKGESAQVSSQRRQVYENIGDSSSEQQQWEKARKAYQQALDLAREPNNAKRKQEEPVLLEKLGDVNMNSKKERWVEAQQYYKESLALKKELAKQDPNKPELKRNESMLLVKLGDLLNTQKKEADAQKFYQESLEILEKLAKQDSNNTGLKRDLFGALVKIGDLLSGQGQGQGKKAEAQQRYQESLDTLQELAIKEPDNNEWQREKSLSMVKIGDLLSAQSKQEEALQHFQESRTILQGLTAKEPSNEAWQSDLVSSYNKTMTALYDLNRFNDAAKMAEELVTHFSDQADSLEKNQNLMGAYQELARYELFGKQPKKAIEASEKGLKIKANEPDKLMLMINLAHGYLFSDRMQKAKPLYLDNKDKKLADGRSFSQAVLDDFKEFKKEGLEHPDIEDIESALH